jgi:hypothetical protein
LIARAYRDTGALLLVARELEAIVAAAVPESPRPRRGSKAAAGARV